MKITTTMALWLLAAAAGDLEGSDGRLAALRRGPAR